MPYPLKWIAAWVSIAIIRGIVLSLIANFFGFIFSYDVGGDTFRIWFWISAITSMIIDLIRAGNR